MTLTIHRLIHGDARNLSFLKDESVPLVVTSPPYWNLTRYNENPDQLGHIQDYEAFRISNAKIIEACTLMREVLLEQIQERGRMVSSLNRLK